MESVVVAERARPIRDDMIGSAEPAFQDPQAEMAAVEAVLGEVLPLAAATPAAVAALQERKLTALLDFVRRRVPFYASLGLPSPARLANFPRIDKATLMGRLPSTCVEPGPTLEELRRHSVGEPAAGANAPLYRDRYFVARTSGTTGFFGFFLWDAAMAEIAEASATRFVPTPRDMPKPVVAVAPVVYWDPLWAVLHGMHVVPFGAGLEGAIDRLHALRPRTILGSTGFVVALAEEQIAGRLRVAPEAVVLGAEQCTTLQWERVRKAWGVEPRMQYGLSEAGLVASRCAAGNWHVHADTVILELLDEHGRPASSGQPCARALLTRLFGPAQPIIRYEVGDVLVPGPPRCPCGAPFPTLAAIQGRSRAVLWLPAERGGVVAVSAYTLIPVLESTHGLIRYQMRYERPGLLELALLTEPRCGAAGFAATLVERLRETLRQHGAVPPRIRVRPGSAPDPWAAPVGSKEHHVALTVTREQVLAATASGGGGAARAGAPRPVARP